MVKSKIPEVCGKVPAWAFAYEQPGREMAYSRLHILSSGTSPPVPLFQLCRTQNSMALSTIRGKCGNSTAYYGMAKHSQHHRSMVQTGFSYHQFHSCFAKSQSPLGSPRPRSWRNAVLLKYRWNWYPSTTYQCKLQFFSCMFPAPQNSRWLVRNCLAEDQQQSKGKQCLSLL